MRAGLLNFRRAPQRRAVIVFSLPLLVAIREHSGAVSADVYVRGENHQWLVFPLIRSWESCSIVK